MHLRAQKSADVSALAAITRTHRGRFAACTSHLFGRIGSSAQEIDHSQRGARRSSSDGIIRGEIHGKRRRRRRSSFSIQTFTTISYVQSLDSDTVRESHGELYMYVSYLVNFS